MNERTSGVEEWSPGWGTTLLWTVLGSALSIAGIVAFAFLYAITHSSEVGVRFEGGEAFGAFVIVIVLTLCLLPIHEGIHGLTMRAFGASPSYGAGVLYRALPYLYCTAPGHRFTGGQFAAVSVAPAAVISLAGAAWVAFLPFGGWMVVPLGLHLGGCVGDVWFLALLLRRSRGELVEDLKTGLRFHRRA